MRHLLVTDSQTLTYLGQTRKINAQTPMRWPVGTPQWTAASSSEPNRAHVVHVTARLEDR